MNEVIAALAGVLVGAIAESVMYGFKRNIERSADLADDLTEALEQLVILYTVKHKHSPNAPEILAIITTIKHRLSRFVRQRSKPWHSKANNELCREFHELQRTHGEIITEDFLNDGKTLATREDTADACRKKAAVAERMIRHIAKIHSMF